MPPNHAHMYGRNCLLAALPSDDIGLLAPYLKQRMLEQGTVLQEQGDSSESGVFPIRASSRLWPSCGKAMRWRPRRSAEKALSARCLNWGHDDPIRERLCR